MTSDPAPGSSRNSRVIRAPRDPVYRAFTDPAALAVWQAHVTMAFDHIPPGIRPEDDEAGTRSSLDELARYVE